MNTSSTNASRCVVVTLALACTLVGTLATPSSADDAVDARFFEERAQAAERRRDVRGALQSYLHAQRIVPSPRLIFETARVAARAGEDALAWSFYERYLELTGDDEGEPETKRARALAERDRLEARGRFGVLEITSEPAGARVHVDRAEYGLAGVTPCRVAVEPGARSLLLEREGFHPTSHAVEVVAGSRATVVVALRARTGRLELAAAPGTRAEIQRVEPTTNVPESEPIEAQAGTSFELPVGTYDVRVLEPRAEPSAHGSTQSAADGTTESAGSSADGTTESAGSSADGTQRAIVREDTTARVELHTEPPRPATGRLLVRSEPPATLRVDGVERAQTPAALTELPVGPHEIELVRAGHVRWRRAIRIGEATTTYLDVRLVRE